MAYAVISRDLNSWTRTPKGNFHDITFDCGHHHRTLEGAFRCLESLRDTIASINACIETVTKDQKYDGKRVEHDNAYYAAAQALFDRR